MGLGSRQSFIKGYQDFTSYGKLGHNLVRMKNNITKLSDVSFSVHINPQRNVFAVCVWWCVVLHVPEMQHAEHDVVTHVSSSYHHEDSEEDHHRGGDSYDDNEYRESNLLQTTLFVEMKETKSYIQFYGMRKGWGTSRLLFLVQMLVPIVARSFTCKSKI